MSAPEITIWVQPLGAGWTPLGSDLGVDVIPDSVSYESERIGGASSATFQLRRHTRASWSDLGPFTPVLIQLGGVNVWRGRIVRTPKVRGTESIYSVECEGMYAHLSDDLTNKGYVNSGAEGWVDRRSYSVSKAVWTGAYNVGSGRAHPRRKGRFTKPGVLGIDCPNGNTVPNSSGGGLIFDAGIGRVVEKVVLTYYGGGHASFDLTGYSESTIGTGAETSILDAAPIATGSTTTSWTPDIPRRWLTLALRNDSGAGVTVAANTAYVEFTKIIVFTSAAYESGNASILKQSDVIKSDLSELCPLISGDTSLIQDSTTSIPHFWPGSWGTARDRFESLQMYDAMQFSITNEVQPRGRFVPVPSTPTWVYDASTDGGSIEDAGANDGQEMYSRAVVSYSDNEGVDTSTAFTTETGSIALTNGTFDVNVTNWTAGSGTTIAQDTSPTYNGSAGSLQLTATGSPRIVSAYTTAFSASIITGRTYTVTGYVRCTQLPDGPRFFTLEAYDSTGTTRYGTSDNDPAGTGIWQKFSLTFVALSSSLRLVFSYGRHPSSSAFANSEVGHVDEVTIELAPNTLIDRRGFTRTLELSAETSTSTAATALADTFLTTAQYPPFKGSLTLTGHARKYGTDEYIPVGQIPAGDALLVMDETNSATGGFGRVGVIERVSYTHNGLQAQVDLDSRQDILDQLVLARKGIS